MSKYEYKVFVNQLTKDGEYKYPSCNQEIGLAKFSKSFNTCYFKNKIFTKVKGGTSKGGNYICENDGQEYRIHKY